MTTTTISLHIPQTPKAPRAAALIGGLVASAIAFLAPAGRPAAPRYPSREAARVRSMAQRMEMSDPRFAAELYAAADRHEMLYGD